MAELEQIKQISIRMKDLREIFEISIDMLSKKLNIDKDVYEKYESSKKDIPVGFLYEFANYFNVSLTTLLTGEEPKLHTYSLVRSGKGLNIERKKPYKYHNLAYNFLNKKGEPFIVTVPPTGDDVPITLSEHEGQEMNYVIEGTLKVLIEDHELILNEGDCLYFDSSKKHGMKAIGGTEAKFLAVIMK